jgi:hypothetical protein
LSSQGPDTNAREEHSAPARRFVSGLAPSGPNSVPDRPPLEAASRSTPSRRKAY